MKFSAAISTGLLFWVSCIFAAEAKLDVGAFTIEVGDTVQYILDNVKALDDAWSPDHLPEDKSHLEHTFFGHSPPVYPSPVGNGKSDESWSTAYFQAKELVSKMTTEEKLNLTRGYRGQCTGVTGWVPRLGIKSICLNDGPMGVRGQDFVSAFPAGIHLAATWDKSLMYDYGRALGHEYRGKGINVALGPCAGPLGRIATGSRNWEGLGSDPYLAEAGMTGSAKGIRDSGVIASLKHWLLNEQEYRRTPSVLGESMSSNVDERTLHEVYALPFMGAIRDGAGSVMCSYNRANNSYACQNSKLLNGVLKTELGFEGFVVSDWGAVRSGVATADAGMDMIMPTDEGFWGSKLLNAVNNGSVTEERANDMATRILAAWYHAGQDKDFPEITAVFHTKDNPSNELVREDVDVRNGHHRLIREVGSAGTILLKNQNNVLPLKKPKYVSVFGYDAVVAPTPWNSPGSFGPRKAIGWIPADNVFSLSTQTTFNGTLVTAFGSGSSNPPYMVDPFTALQKRVFEDNGIIKWDFYNVDPIVYVNSDVCLIFINSYPGEGKDRAGLSDDFSDQLVLHVAKRCANTVVVIHAAGIRLVDAWADHPNVTAIVNAGMPGQEAGNSVVDILYGDVNPSGRLPYTIAHKESDYGPLLGHTINDGESVWFPQSNFDEALFVDHRYFDLHDITPRYEFGYGLSYTNFDYSRLVVQSLAGSIAGLPDPEKPIVQGGHPDLWEIQVIVTADITNTGDVTGSEVAQLYLGIPVEDTPVRQLRGFERVEISPGGTRHVTFALNRRDISFWDVTAQQWRIGEGEFKVYVGTSSRDLRLEGSFQMSS
ncbi:glycosyl hydrolase family 3 N terminal domain-containing protein [Seiridium cupressi]